MFLWRKTIGTLTEPQAMQTKSQLKYQDSEKIHIYLQSLFLQRKVDYNRFKDRS